MGQKVNCLFCNKSHRLENCFGFQNVSVEERWDFAKIFSLCFLWLEKFHPRSSCQIYRSCNIEKCTKRHHPLLHALVSINEPDNNIETGNYTQGYCSMVKPFTSKDVEPINIMPSAIAFATNGVNHKESALPSILCVEILSLPKTLLRDLI